MIEINDRLSIAEDELVFTASRSSGPGGQNINKVNSRVTLTFDVQASCSLDAWQKERIARKLSNRISKSGVLSLSSQQHRTQLANRRAVTVRFQKLLAGALEIRPRRRPTRTPRRVKERRLEQKRRRSQIKRLRSRPGSDG